MPNILDARFSHRFVSKQVPWVIYHQLSIADTNVSRVSNNCIHHLHFCFDYTSPENVVKYFTSKHGNYLLKYVVDDEVYKREKENEFSNRKSSVLFTGNNQS